MRWHEASFMGARGYGATFPDAEGVQRGLIAAYMPLVGEFFWVALPKPTVGGPALSGAFLLSRVNVTRLARLIIESNGARALSETDLSSMYETVMEEGAPFKPESADRQTLMVFQTPHVFVYADEENGSARVTLGKPGEAEEIDAQPTLKVLCGLYSPDQTCLHEGLWKYAAERGAMLPTQFESGDYMWMLKTRSGQWASLESDLGYIKTPSAAIRLEDDTETTLRNILDEYPAAGSDFMFDLGVHAQNMYIVRRAVEYMKDQPVLPVFEFDREAAIIRTAKALQRMKIRDARARALALNR